MHFQTGIVLAVALLVDTISAKTLSFQPRGWKSTRDLDIELRRATSAYEAEHEKRSAATTSPSAVTSQSSAINATQVSTACMSAVSSMTSVNNTAGFAGCYNILAWDAQKLMFQADLRIYQQGTPSGEFANISSNQITVMLSFPEGTQYSAMIKRSVIELHQLDGTLVQSQQFSLLGSINKQAGTLSLNQTLLASLMVPQITLQATSPATQNRITTNMTASDSAWFVTGQFNNIARSAAQIANPATASAAVIASKGFVLPGTTFGIFPTSLIVTSLWTIMFFIAFGFGTIGRIRSRDLYRKRITRFPTRQKV